MKYIVKVNITVEAKKRNPFNKIQEKVGLLQKSQINTNQIVLISRLDC